MAKFDPGSRDPNALWRCPCGVVLPYGRMLGHRRNRKKHPECDQGSITPLEDDPEGQSQEDVMTGSTDDHVDNSDSTPSADSVDGGSRPRSSSYEILPDLPDLGDADALTEWMNEQLGGGEESPVPPALSVEDLFGSDAGGGELPPGNGSGPPRVPSGGGYRIEQPPIVAPTQYKVNVAVPNVIVDYYQYARGQGWAVGDRSLATFVVDQLLEHFRFCRHLGVYVGDRDEIEGNGA